MKKNAIKFSIRFKYILFVTFLVLILSGIHSFLTIQNQTKALKNEIIKRAKVIVRKLANDSRDAILTKDDLTLFTSIKNTIAEKGILYAMILNQDKVPICHNDTKYLSEHKFSLKDHITVKAFKSDTILVQDIFYKGESSFDVSSPIIWNMKKIGLIRIGFSKKPIKEAIKSTTYKTIMVAFIAIVIGILFTIFLTSYIIEPIKVLMKGVERISSGNFDKIIKTKHHDEFMVLADTFNKMQKSIKQMMTEIAKQEAVKRELEIASEIQKMLIPKESPKIDGLDIAGYSQQAAEVGGDYFDFSYIDKTNHGTILADVSGHGISAALIMVMVRMIFKTISKNVKTPAELLILINKLLERELIVEKFVTMIYYSYNTETGKLILSNAGHQPLLWFKFNEKKIHEVTTTGFPIGVMDNFEYKNRDISLSKGDIIIVYTDGFVELKNENKDEFGLERLKDIVLKHYESSSELITKHIIDAGSRFTNLPMQDDKTIVILKVVE